MADQNEASPKQQPSDVPNQQPGGIRSPLRTTPEDGAQVAAIADAVIPGGRAFVQQLYRARKDVLKGISFLLDAQITDLERVDATLDELSKKPQAPLTMRGLLMGTSRPPSVSLASIGEMVQKAGDKFMARKPKSASRPAIPASSQGATAAPASTGSSPGDLMQKMGEKFLARKPKSASRQATSTASSASTAASHTSGDNAGNNPAPAAPEKISIT